MVKAETGLLSLWSEVSAAWLAQIDDRTFPSLVEQALLRLVRFDSTVAFAYPSAGPLLLHDGLGAVRSPASMAAYLSGTYLLDPFYLACVSQRPCGLYRMSEIAPDLYSKSDYFHSPQVHPCISMESGSLSEEIAYLIRLTGGSMVAFSLMRSNSSGPFNAFEISLLRAVEPFVRAALQRHWRRIGPSASRGQSTQVAPDMLLEGFARFASDRLTRQQQRIVQLLLQGHSSLSVGRQLGITEGTVKNHRHAIYQRLGIATQSELFALFVRELAR